MSAPAGQGGSGCLFWLIVIPLVGGVLSTTAFIAWTYLRHERRAEQAAQGLAAEQVSNQGRIQNLCEAYRRLARPGAPEPTSREVLDQVAPAEGMDSWGHPFEYQPWDHAVRSYGPDAQRGTPDDLLVSCVRH